MAERLPSIGVTGAACIYPSLDHCQASLNFTPDAAGNRIGSKDAKGTQSTGTFDIADRPTSLVTSDGSVTLNWRRDGTLRSIEQSNGTTSTYDYDHAKRVELITHRVGGVPSLTLAYDYDANGNRTDETRTEIALPGQPARTVHTHYGFDSDDRLTSAEVTHTPANPQTPNTRTVWTLDPVGNRLTEVVTNTQTNQALNSKTYTYSPRDQLETVTDSVTQLRVVYGYDLNGNRTQRTVTRGPGNTLVSRTFYRFDARDRLVKAEPEAPNPTNIPTVEFVYDAEDRKIARIETPWLNGNPVQANATATVSLYDGQTLLHEAKPGSGGTSNSQGLIITDTYRNSAKLDRHVSYGPNGTDQPTIRFYQLDALGTPLILTDSNGQAIVSNTVDAWGNTIQQTADGNSTAPVNSGNQNQDPNQTGQAALLTNDDQSIGFTGYQKDEELGLYYAGARFYDPLTGGFGAMDPWTGDTGRPITLNKYLYANGNPVVYVDPSGNAGQLTTMRDTYDQLDKNLRSYAEAHPAIAMQAGGWRGVASVSSLPLRAYNFVSDVGAASVPESIGGETTRAARAELTKSIVNPLQQYQASMQADPAGTIAAMHALPAKVVGTTIGELLAGSGGAFSDASKFVMETLLTAGAPGAATGAKNVMAARAASDSKSIAGAAAQRLDRAADSGGIVAEAPGSGHELRLGMSQTEVDQNLVSLNDRGKVFGDPGVVRDKYRTATDANHPESKSATAELRVARMLRDQGADVYMIDDTLATSGNRPSGRTNDFTILGRNSVVQADVKRLSGIGRNAAKDMAKGVRQVGDNGVVYVVRGAESKASFEEFSDFVQGFSPDNDSVRVVPIDEAELPGLLGQ